MMHCKIITATPPGPHRHHPFSSHVLVWCLRLKVLADKKKKKGRVSVRENISFLAKLFLQVWWKSPSGVRHHLFWLDTGSCFKLVGTHYSKVFSFFFFFLNTYNWLLNSQRYYSPPKQKENAERSGQTRRGQALNVSTIIIVRTRSVM